jgi:uncharacterized Zn finger protein (UPF0148 family)
MTNCEYCGHLAKLEGDGIHEERGWVCTAHCNQETHECPYDGETLKVTGAGEFTCPNCERVFDLNMNLKEGDPLFDQYEILEVFNECEKLEDFDPLFEKDGFVMLASIARAYIDHTDQLKRKDVRIQWRHTPFEGVELLGKTAEWQDAYSTEESEG